MQDVLAGIRVIEVASWTFVPISGAVLSEWGADVIKVEQPASGDPQRGLVSSGLVPGAGGVNFMFEIPNRGKRSVGLDISTDDGRALLYRLVEGADVFVTNYLPDVRSASGSTSTTSGRTTRTSSTCGAPDRGRAGPRPPAAASTAPPSGARAGLAMAFKEPAAEWPVDQRPAFGDVFGGLTIVGGIAAALLRRERSGVATTVDVSLLNLGLWGLAPEVTSAKLYEHIEIPSFDRDTLPNPLVGTFPTKDGRFIILVLLQADRYWPDLCAHLERPDLLEDPRFPRRRGAFRAPSRVHRGAPRRVPDAHLRRMARAPPDPRGRLGPPSRRPSRSTTTSRPSPTATSSGSPPAAGRSSRSPRTPCSSTRRPRACGRARSR